MKSAVFQPRTDLPCKDGRSAPRAGDRGGQNDRSNRCEARRNYAGDDRKTGTHPMVPIVEPHAIIRTGPVWLPPRLAAQFASLSADQREQLLALLPTAGCNAPPPAPRR